MSEKYYTTFNQQGYRTGTYIESVHGREAIPVNSIPLETDEWELYCTGEYRRNMETGEPEKVEIEPNLQSPAELREQAYETLAYKTDDIPLILWEGKASTVDQATKICLAYWVEGNPKWEQLQLLIVEAKNYIRELYPDA